MTRADLIAKLRATADARDDDVSDLLLEAADALKAAQPVAPKLIREAWNRISDCVTAAIEQNRAPTDLRQADWLVVADALRAYVGVAS